MGGRARVLRVHCGDGAERGEVEAEERRRAVLRSAIGELRRGQLRGCGGGAAGGGRRRGAGGGGERVVELARQPRGVRRQGGADEIGRHCAEAGVDLTRRQAEDLDGGLEDGLELLPGWHLDPDVFVGGHDMRRRW